MKQLIKGQRISLFYLDETMINDVWQNSLDEDNRKYVPDEVFETYEDASSVVLFLMENYKANVCPLVFAIFTNEGNHNIGYVQLVEIPDGYEIGYHIAKSYTNQGYATEAVNLFLKYLKDNSDIDKIYGIALAINHASQKVLKKTGFELIFEGMSLYQGKRRKIIKTVKAVK